MPSRAERKKDRSGPVKAKNRPHDNRPRPGQGHTARPASPDQPPGLATTVADNFKAALEAGATATFTYNGAGCTVIVVYREETFTGHAENAVAALGKALAALPV